MKKIWTLWTENPLIPALTGVGAILVLAALGFAYFEAATQGEHVGFFEGLWWAVVTLFTVGYGDFVPKTWPGRLLGIGVMASGIGLVSAVTGIMASWLVERRLEKQRGKRAVMTSGHILILGWNAHGLTLLEGLRKQASLAQAQIILVAGLDPARFEEVADASGLGDRLLFVRGAASSKTVLERANPSGASIAFLLADEDIPPAEADNANVLATLTLRGLAPNLPLYAEALQAPNREHLLRAGVTKCLSRDELVVKALGFVATHPVMYEFLLALLDGGAPGSLSYRPMTPDEKNMVWNDLVRNVVALDGKVPLAACRLPSSLSLSDVLDTTQALDNYILELFKNAGRHTGLGNQGARVVLNPGNRENLAEFDGILFLSARP